MGVAHFKQSNGMYAINIVAACGVLTTDQIIGLGNMAQDCEVFRFKLTTRQTIVAVLDEKKVSCLVERLTGLGLVVSPYGNVVRAVKACAGNAVLCPRALGDALDLGIEIQEKYMGHEVPKDVKIAVAGCSRGCTDPLCADIGVIAGGNNFFDVYIGGRGAGKNPVHGTLLAEKVQQKEVSKLLEYVLGCYKALAQPKERISSVVLRLGIDPFLPEQGLLSAPESKYITDEEFLEFLNAKGSETDEQ